MKDVIVYTTAFCPYCTRVKTLLDARGVRYPEVDRARNPEGRIELVRKTGMMTFALFVIDGELLGGFHETAQADRSGRLHELVSRAA